MSHNKPLHIGAPIADRVRAAIKADTGDAFHGCPWRTFSDPFVIDVIHATKMVESGQLALLMGPDPPAALLHGVMHYHAMCVRLRLAKIRAKKT